MKSRYKSLSEISGKKIENKFHNINKKILWEHDDAKNYYNKMVDKYGKPNIKDFNPGGIAIWSGRTLSKTCIHRIELHDESIHHCSPQPHKDFLYSFINYQVHYSKLKDVLSLSGSLTYDPLKKLLRARCGAEEANIATLLLATNIANGTVIIDNRHSLHDKYKKSIVNALSNPVIANDNYNKLCKNINLQSAKDRAMDGKGFNFVKCCDGYDVSTNTCQ